jgi:hypothetical protein
VVIFLCTNILVFLLFDSLYFPHIFFQLTKT